jgi:hypothetical protein
MGKPVVVPWERHQAVERTHTCACCGHEFTFVPGGTAWWYSVYCYGCSVRHVMCRACGDRLKLNDTDVLLRLTADRLCPLVTSMFEALEPR